MQTYQQTFASATTWQLNVPGKYFVTLACTQSINVRFYLGGSKLDMGDISGLLAGLEVGPLAALKDPASFDRVEIDVQAGDTVQIGIGNGAARYNRASTSATITQNKNPISAAFANTAKTITSTSAQLVAASPGRQYLLVQNRDPSGNIYLNFGAGAATAGNGVKIAPGGAFEMNVVNTSTSIQAIGDIASNANVLVVEG